MSGADRTAAAFPSSKGNHKPDERDVILRSSFFTYQSKHKERISTTFDGKVHKLQEMGYLDGNTLTAGRQAAIVLKKLGAADSDKAAVLDLMAALNLKGWLSSGGGNASGAKRTRAICVAGTYHAKDQMVLTL